MIALTAWAHRYGVSPTALAELLHIMGAAVPPHGAIPPHHTAPPTATSEAGVQQARVLKAAQSGNRLWRNNSGACEDSTGRMIRYGLGNISAQVNRVMKSSDLIGITVTTCPCGHKYGVFTALECKAPGWRLTPGDQRGQAQWNFIKLVTSLHGIGRFVTNGED